MILQMAAQKEDGDSTKSTENILEVDTFPFRGLKISENWEKLESVTGRTTCAICKKSRKYFCYSCYVAVPEIQSFIPHLKLPVKIDIIKHAREMDGKSTAVHAAVLAPEHVRIFTYPCIPDYSTEENVVLIYPNKDAVSVEEVFERFMSSNDGEPVRKRPCQDQVSTTSSGCLIHRAVFIDSTWNQSRGIFKDPRIKALPSVVLKSRLSQFWRHQADSPRWYLATVEAIHQFLIELDAAQWLFDRNTFSCHLKDHDDKTSQSNNSENTNISDVVSSECYQSVKSGMNTNLSTTKIDPSTDIEKVSTAVVNAKNDSEIITKDNSCLRTHSISSIDDYVYNGDYDNLLFFFRFMYSKIHTLYDHEQLKSYKRRLE